MWACYFKDGELIVSTLRGTQKGSQYEACKITGVNRWSDAKSRGVRCHQVTVERKDT